LILDGHGFQVTIQALKQEIKVGLNMVTLPLILHMCYNHWMSHASNIQNMFLKIKRLYHGEFFYLQPNKATLVARVDKALQQSLKKKT
jgi:hypothetical protein